MSHDVADFNILAAFAEEQIGLCTDTH